MRLFELSKKERDVIEKKSVEKTTFFEKTLEQNLTQILIFHIFKMTEKTCFFQLTGFLGDVIAEKHTFFRLLTSSLRVKIENHENLLYFSRGFDEHSGIHRSVHFSFIQ